MGLFVVQPLAHGVIDKTPSAEWSHHEQKANYAASWAVTTGRVSLIYRMVVARCVMVVKKICCFRYINFQ